MKLKVWVVLQIFGWSMGKETGGKNYGFDYSEMIEDKISKRYDLLTSPVRIYLKSQGGDEAKGVVKKHQIYATATQSQGIDPYPLYIGINDSVDENNFVSITAFVVSRDLAEIVSLLRMNEESFSEIKRKVDEQLARLDMALDKAINAQNSTAEPEKPQTNSTQTPETPIVKPQTSEPQAPPPSVALTSPASFSEPSLNSTSSSSTKMIDQNDPVIKIFSATVPDAWLNKVLKKQPGPKSSSTTSKRSLAVHFEGQYTS